MATKKVARPLVQKIALLTQELHLPEGDAARAQADLIALIRQSLNDDGICLLPSITDCQWSETAHGDTVTVMVELTMIDSTSGDLVTLAWAGQAHGQGDDLVDLASDRALEGALLRAFSIRSLIPNTPTITKPEASAQPDVVEDSEEIEEVQEIEAAEEIVAPVEEAVELPVDDVVDEAVDAEPAAEALDPDELDVIEEAVEEAVEEAEVEAIEEAEVVEEVDAEVEAPAEEAEVVEEVEAVEQVEALNIEDEPVEDEADASPEDDEEAAIVEDEVAEQDAADVGAEDDAVDVVDEEADEAPVEATNDVEAANEDEAESEVEGEAANEDEADDEVGEPAPVGFSLDPLWREYFEAMLDSLQGLDGQRDFFERLAARRGVAHINWLSPEQLQLELNALDDFGYDEEYLLNPERELFVGGEQFMDALQRATSGLASQEFRALYLERMDAELLTDVEERKLQAMVNKLMAMSPAGRAEYVETVLAEER